MFDTDVKTKKIENCLEILKKMYKKVFRDLEKNSRCRNPFGFIVILLLLTLILVVVVAAV